MLSKRGTALHLLAAALASMFAGGAIAAVVGGTVKDQQGNAIAGAMVTATDSKRGLGETVYTDGAGKFELNTALSGEISLRVRKYYFADEIKALTLKPSDRLNMPISLSPFKSDEELSNSLPALSHFSKIAFDDGAFSRAQFARDCLSCHALGNSFTRWPRPPEGWLPTVQRMHAYLGNGDTEMMKRRAELLSQAFDGKPVLSRPVFPVDPTLYKARVRQYRLDGAGVPHDAAFSARDGKVYTVDMFVDQVLVTDLKTGVTEGYPETADGLPPGGKFTQMGMQAPYGLTITRAPHSLAEGHDGRFYLTESIGGSIGSFDPQTKKFEHFDVGSGSIYPHTIRVDKEGIAWFTLAFSNQVGRFDPATKKMDVIKLPDTKSNGAACCPVPYGIDVSPIDGSLWYTKLFSDKIGRIDPKTLEITEFDSPVSGPRRQRFDAKGYLWVAGFSDGAIAKIDTQTMASRVYPLPMFTPGEVLVPYALAVHPKTQEVWVNDTTTDSVFRFIPSEERFVVYPMPLRGTYTRDFTFTSEGWACTANNPIPVAALEGNVAELLCIDTGDKIGQASN